MLPRDCRHRILHHVESMWHITQTCQQNVFEQGQTRVYCWRGVQPLADFGGRAGMLAIPFDCVHSTLRVTPEEIDIAMIYDSFTITVAVMLEDLGCAVVGPAGGFGLGLASTLGLAQLISGTCGVQAGLTRGAAFYIRLPAQPAADEARCAA